MLKTNKLNKDNKDNISITTQFFLVCITILLLFGYHKINPASIKITIVDKLNQYQGSFIIETAKCIFGNNVCNKFILSNKKRPDKSKYAGAIIPITKINHSAGLKGRNIPSANITATSNIKLG